MIRVSDSGFFEFELGSFRVRASGSGFVPRASVGCTGVTGGGDDVGGTGTTKGDGTNVDGAGIVVGRSVDGSIADGDGGADCNNGDAGYNFIDKELIEGNSGTSGGRDNFVSIAVMQLYGHPGVDKCSPSRRG